MPNTKSGQTAYTQGYEDGQRDQREHNPIPSGLVSSQREYAKGYRAGRQNVIDYLHANG